MSNLLIKWQTSEQIGPDDFRITHKEKIFSEDAKLSTIRDWIISQGGYSTESNGYKRMTEVFLSEPQ